MFTIMPPEGNLLWVKVSGKLTHADYQQLVPAWEQMLAREGALRLLFEMGPDFDGWEPGAAWDDVKFSVSHRDRLDRVAMVGSEKWQEIAAKAGSLLVKAEVRFFDSANLEAARAWLAS